MSSFGLPSPRPGRAGPLRFVREPLVLGGFNYVWEDSSDITLATDRATQLLSQAKQVSIPPRGILLYGVISCYVVNNTGGGAYIHVEFGFKIGAAEYWVSDERKDANYTYRGSGFWLNQSTADKKSTDCPWTITVDGTIQYGDDDQPVVPVDIEQSGFPAGPQSVQPIARRGLGPLLAGTGALKGTLTPTRVGILFAEW